MTPELYSRIDSVMAAALNEVVNYLTEHKERIHINAEDAAEIRRRCSKVWDEADQIHKQDMERNKLQ